MKMNTVHTIVYKGPALTLGLGTESKIESSNQVPVAKSFVLKRGTIAAQEICLDMIWHKRLTLQAATVCERCNTANSQQCGFTLERKTAS